MYGSDAVGVGGTTLAATGVATGSILISLIASTMLLFSGIMLVVRRKKLKGTKP